MTLEQPRKDVDVVADYTQSKTVETKMTLDIMSKFKKYLHSKYPDEEEAIKNQQKELDNIVLLGIDNVKTFENKKLLFKGKKPRKDVLVNLSLIAEQLQKYNLYPEIHAKTFHSAVDEILKNKDHRTIAKYKKNILNYCIISESKANKVALSGRAGDVGFLNFELYVNVVENYYRNATTSTSSFNETTE